MKAGRQIWLWLAAAELVSGGAVVAFVHTSSASRTDDSPVMFENAFVESVTSSSGPAELSPALQMDDDVSALASACSCDATSPEDGRRPELEDCRTDQETGDPRDLRIGMVSLQRTDLSMIGRGVRVAPTRSYNPELDAKANLYPLGQGWTHNSNSRPANGTETASPGAHAVYRLYGSGLGLTAKPEAAPQPAPPGLRYVGQEDLES